MNDNTLLFRHVHPNWIQDGRVTSQVFRPTPKDESLLSVYDGDLIPAEDAWKHFTGTLNFSAAGTLAVTVFECNRQELRIPAEFVHPFQSYPSTDSDLIRPPVPKLSVHFFSDVGMVDEFPGMVDGLPGTLF